MNGFTEDHKAAFARHGVRNVWIAYDRDEAGDTAAERLKEELAGMGIGTHRVLFPRGCDANEYARTGESLAVLLNRAEWWGKPAEAAKEEMPVGAEIPTPHVQERPKNTGPQGQVNLGPQTTRPATKQDIRTAGRLAKQQGLLP